MTKDHLQDAGHRDINHLEMPFLPPYKHSSVQLLAARVAWCIRVAESTPLQWVAPRRGGANMHYAEGRVGAEGLQTIGWPVVL